ncbi:hypothetical protein QQP08_004437 [Theobroma cacao]|nr:hypothetical protein QQP08_004437 [Theobroma cacao]
MGFSSSILGTNPNKILSAAFATKQSWVQPIVSSIVIMCFMNLVLDFPQEIQVPVLPGYPLHPVVIGDGYRCACGATVEEHGFSYCNCGSQYYLSFQLRCANSLMRALKSKSHKHPLFYFGTERQRLFGNMDENYKHGLSICKRCHESLCDVEGTTEAVEESSIEDEQSDE